MNDTFEHDGLTFRVTLEPDYDHGAPWNEDVGHGDVRYTGDRGCNPAKLPGDLILRSDSDGTLLYDFAGACRIALRDGWGARDAEPGMTKRQVAALAAREDFEHLRAWCNDQWCYVVVSLTLLDLDGISTAFCSYLGGVYCDGGEIDEAAYLVDMANDIIADAGLNVDGANSVTVGATTQIVREATA